MVERSGMVSLMHRPLLVALLAATPLLAVAAEGPPTLAIGTQAPDFDLPGVDGRNYQLADFSDAQVLVLVFTANHCPTAQAYEDRVEALSRDYRDRGVVLVAISPNDPRAIRLDELGFSDLSDSFDDMKQRARDTGIEYPYLYDGETQAVSRQYGPVATPHVFVFDRERKLRFQGRIDDGENPAKVKVSDTRNAIEALLSARPVPVATTKVFGCSIKWADKSSWTLEAQKAWAAEPVTLEAVGEARVAELVRNPTRKLRLVNVWATWCGPCVIEFPELVSINRMYRGRDFEMVTISADVPERRAAALAFLLKQQASTLNVLFEKGDPYALVDVVDPEWRGALPHTILVAPGGTVIHRSEGTIDPLQVKKAIVGYLGRYYHSVPGQP